MAIYVSICDIPVPLFHFTPPRSCQTLLPLHVQTGRHQGLVAERICAAVRRVLYDLRALTLLGFWRQHHCHLLAVELGHHLDLGQILEVGGETQK